MTLHVQHGLLLIMKIYLVEIYEQAVTGFTTYKHELFSCLQNFHDIKLNIITLECPVEEFGMSTSDDGRVACYSFPHLKSHSSDAVGAVLQLYIPDAPDNVFLLNFAPTYPTVAMLRECFPNGKVVNVIHDLMWASFLMGDVERFKRIVRGEEADIKGGLIQAIYKDGVNACMASDVNVCLSEDTLELLNGFYGIPLSKLVVIPNGLEDTASGADPYEVRARYGIPVGDKILLYVGRASRQKGLADVLSHFDLVLSRVPSCRLVMAGEIDGYSIGRISADYRKNITILGVVSKDCLYGWYRAADAGIVPSYYEQCSYSGIEMKMFGLPIVASSGFGVRRMFTPENSIVADIGDRNDADGYGMNLAECMVEILTMPEDRLKRLGEESRRHYEATYSQKRMRDKYVSLFHALLEKPRDFDPFGQAGLSPLATI